MTRRKPGSELHRRLSGVLLEQAAQMRSAGKSAGKRQLGQRAVLVSQFAHILLKQRNALGPDILVDAQFIIGKGVLEMALAAVERSGHAIGRQARVTQMLADISPDAAVEQLAGAQR